MSVKQNSYTCQCVVFVPILPCHIHFMRGEEKQQNVPVYIANKSNSIDMEGKNGANISVIGGCSTGSIFRITTSAFLGFFLFLPLSRLFSLIKILSSNLTQTQSEIGCNHKNSM